jgi:GT2 family glycosyltransferase
VKLGVPTYCRYDLLDELLLSAERGFEKPDGYIIIDNGNAYPRARLNALLGQRASVAELIAPGRNLGVAASWNRILDMTRGEAVVISNDDVVLSERSFRDLLAASKAAPFVGDGWFLFAQTPECTRRVGYYDENFWPGYYEDSDYQVRLHKAGITRLEHWATDAYVHHQSATTGQLGEDWIREHREMNRLYFLRKWNGLMLGQDPLDFFEEPFCGVPPFGWRLRSPATLKRG